MKIRLVTALTIALLISFSGCNDRQGMAGKSPEYFLLSGGRFKRVSGMTGLPARDLVAWTVQERVSDIAFDSGKILFAINGYGIAFTDTNKAGDGFHYFFDKELFSGKTITTIIPFGDDACCHFYFNSSLSANELSHNADDRANFVFFPVQDVMDRFTRYTLPFERVNQEFEAVGFIPVTKVHWVIEWKSSGNQTKFDYTKYDMAGRAEEKITRDEFRRAYDFKDISGIGIAEELKLISLAAAAGAGRAEGTTTYHYLLKVKETNLCERYALRAGLDPSDSDFEIVNIPMFRDERGIYAISGEDALLFIAYDSDIVRKTELPMLPSMYEYTELFVHGSDAYLPWEESIFYKTGNAGLARVYCNWN